MTNPNQDNQTEQERAGEEREAAQKGVSVEELRESKRRNAEGK